MSAGFTYFIFDYFISQDYTNLDYWARIFFVGAVIIYLDCFSMMVDLPLFVIPEGVHVGVDQDNNEGVE